MNKHVVTIIVVAQLLSIARKIRACLVVTAQTRSIILRARVLKDSLEDSVK